MHLFGCSIECGLGLERNRMRQFMNRIYVGCLGCDGRFRSYANVAAAAPISRAIDVAPGST